MSWGTLKQFDIPNSHTSLNALYVSGRLLVLVCLRVCVCILEGLSSLGSRNLRDWGLGHFRILGFWVYDSFWFGRAFSDFSSCFDTWPFFGFLIDFGFLIFFAILGFCECSVLGFQDFMRLDHDWSLFSQIFYTIFSLFFMFICILSGFTSVGVFDLEIQWFGDFWIFDLGTLGFGDFAAWGPRYLVTWNIGNNDIV